MRQRYVCPNCGTSNTRFRATLGSHVCQRCGHEWAQTRVGKRSNPFKRIMKWIAVPLSLIALLYMLIGMWDAVAFFGIPAIVLWGFIMKMTISENKLQPGQPGSIRVKMTIGGQNNEGYLCQNRDCGNELSNDEQFCSICGTPRARPLTVSEFLKCGSCDRKFDRNVQYCPGCGTQAY